MRQVFDSSVPVHEQLSRIVKCHTGWRHTRGLRGRPGRAAKVDSMGAKRRKAQAKYSAQVAAYWRGETDTHP